MKRALPISRGGTAIFAGCFLSLGMAVVPDARAATLTVTNCNDSGPNSLRERVAAAVSSDTIDLRGLSCRGINLASGPIAVVQNTLTLHGPGFRRLTINGNYLGSVIRHTGTGALRLRGLSIVRGNHQAQQARGGCVYSAGNISAYDVEIRSCGAHGLGDPPTTGQGGAVYAAGNVRLSHSGILQSTARGRFSMGGGIYAGGRLNLQRVLVWGSDARNGGGAFAAGGADLDTVTFTRNLSGESGGALLSQNGSVTIANSAIHDNTSNGNSAGVALNGLGSKLIVNSTLSGNRAPSWSAGVGAGDVTLSNTTIAFNHNHSCNAAFGGVSLHLESTIAASNTCGEGLPEQDLMDYDDPQPITGADNLVMSANVPLPADTITADPMLAPLADNGGRTQTHALQNGSPGIDEGNNAAGLPYDQRGPGFPRVVGAQADIGAFER